MRFTCYFLASAVLLISFQVSAIAHPGRTDSNGGHTCRTNCEKWGYEYLEYHYHDKTKKAKKEARKSARTSARQSF